MLPKSAKWLEDIRVSAKFILDFTTSKTLGDYRSDPLLRAAVERHFEIIGEAMNRLAHYDQDVATLIDDYPRIIAFRNLLIHGYDLVDHEAVWAVIRDHLASLYAQVQAMLCHQ